jgi:two-component system, chemotaxis family, CheB/CheR fusion protein
LERLIAEVIETISVQQRDVRDSQGRWFQLTIRPYKNVDNRIDGAVLALFNSDDVRKHEVEAQAVRELADGLLTVAPQPQVILEEEHKVMQANAAFSRLLHVDGADVRGKSIFELAGGIWNTPEIRLILENASVGSSATQEVALPLPANASKPARLTARKVRGSGDSSLTILAIQTDGLIGSGDSCQ